MSPVHVIMPVYRGDEHWLRALNSLARCRSLFGQLVVSFDGPGRVQLSELLRSGFHQILDPTILVTPTEMTSVEHALWLIEQPPIVDWASDQLVMLMGEDDLPCPTALAKGFEALESEAGAILFGSWTIHRPNHERIGTDPPGQTDGLRIFSGRDIAPRLQELAKSGEPTTISGITLNAAALRSYYRQIRGQSSKRLLLHGIRTEFFVATQPTITSLVQMDQPIFEIQTHANQEGLITPSNLKHHDEALYQLWLMMTPQPIRIGDRLVSALRLVKRTAMNPSVLLDLVNAVRTFRETHRAA